jgi:hypothetical protein
MAFGRKKFEVFGADFGGFHGNAYGFDKGGILPECAESPHAGEVAAAPA